MGITHGGPRGGHHGGPDGGIHGTLAEAGRGWRVDLRTRSAGAATGPTPPERHVLREDTLLSVDYQPEHTAMADVEIDIPPLSGLEPREYLGAHLDLWRNGELWATTSVDDFASASDGTLTLTARSRTGKRLSGDEIEAVYRHERTHEALADLWERVGIDATVHPPPDSPVDNERVQTATAAGDFRELVVARPRDDRGRFVAADDDAASGTGEFLATDPLEIVTTSDGVGIQPLPTNTLIEAENTASAKGGLAFKDFQTSESSGDAKVRLEGKNASVAYEFEQPYEIPSGECAIAIRAWRPNSCNAVLAVKLDDDLVEYVPAQRALRKDYSWHHVGPLSDELSADSHEVRVEIYDEPGPVHLDLVSIYDDRFNYSWANTTDNNGALAGPELYPDAVSVPLRPAVAGLDVDSVTVSAQVDHNGEWTALGAAVSDTRESESVGFGGTELSVTMPIAPERPAPSVRGLIDLSRYADGRTTTPTEGNAPQTLTKWTVSVDGNAIPVIDRKELSGPPFGLLQQLHKDADMRFALSVEVGDGVTAESWTTGDPTVREDPAVMTGDLLGWIATDVDRDAGIGEYANRVTVVGAETGRSGRYRATAEDEQAIEQNGLEAIELRDDGQTTTGDCLSKARAELRKRLDSDTVGGSVAIVPTRGALPTPGKPYRVRAFEDGEIRDVPGTGGFTDEFTDVYRDAPREAWRSDESVGGYGRDYDESYNVRRPGEIWSSLESVSLAESAGDAGIDLDFERPSGAAALVAALAGSGQRALTDGGRY